MFLSISISISIFSKMSLSISISIFSKISLSISISISIFFKSVDISTIDIRYRYIEQGYVNVTVGKEVSGRVFLFVPSSQQIFHCQDLPRFLCWHAACVIVFLVTFASSPFSYMPAVWPGLCCAIPFAETCWFLILRLPTS